MKATVRIFVLLLVLPVLAHSVTLPGVTLQTGALALSPVDAHGKFSEKMPAALAALLQDGIPVSAQLNIGTKIPRDSKGHWSPDALRALLIYKGPYYIKAEDASRAGAILERFPEIIPGEIEKPLTVPRMAEVKGMTKVLFVEGNATIDPYSSALAEWGWPAAILDSDKVEKDPTSGLNAKRSDLILFGSPGWWDDFTNPPSGPSRMLEGTSDALREFVYRGGTAHFMDIAQWDLERTWPGSIELENPGPYQSVSFEVEGGGIIGDLALVANGMTVTSLKSERARGLVSNPSYPFPSGKKKMAYASYLVTDPSGGRGMIYGQSFNPMYEEESGKTHAKLYFLNLLLFSGSDRLGLSDEKNLSKLGARPNQKKNPKKIKVKKTPMVVKVATLPPATHTPIPVPANSPEPAPVPSPTLEPVPVPTLKPTAVPVVVPTLKLTLVPVPVPTLKPAARKAPPMLVPRRVEPTATPPPRRIPTAIPTLRHAMLKPSPTTVTWSQSDRKPARPPSPLLVPTTGIVTPRPTVVLNKQVRGNLGCLQNSPEPFGAGGTYVIFCLKRPAEVTLRVYTEDGVQKREMKPRKMEAGKHQLFFDSLDTAGKPLVAGRYLYNVEARDEAGVLDRHQSVFTRKREKQRWQ